MTTLQRLNFTEEQREYIKSILKERKMSRVALIIYLVRIKSSDAIIDDTDYETDSSKEFISGITDILYRMSDKEYSDIMLEQLQ